MADQELIQKWQRILATRKEPEIQARAREVLQGLGVAESAPAEAPPTPPPKEERGVFGRLKDETVRELSAIPQAVKSLNQGFNDHFAFGLPSKVLDMTGAFPQQAQQANREAGGPVSTMLGQMAGLGASAIAGPEAALGRSGQALLGMMESKVPALANTIIGRLAGQTGLGAGIGATANAAATATDGGDWRDVARSVVAGGKGGAIVGGGLGGLSELATGGANAIASSVGGRARELLEKYGASVGPLSSGSGGALAESELAGLKANDRGIGEASRGSAARILKGIEDAHYADTVLPTAAKKAAVAQSEVGQDMRDATPLYSELVKLERSQRLTPSERSQVGGVLNRMDKLLESRGSVEMTETELNDFKGMLQDLSDVGSMNSPSVLQSKLGNVASSAKSIVDRGPYAEINADASKGIQKYERQRSLLDLKPRPSGGRPSPEGPSEEEIAKLANMMSRQGQNTVTSGARNTGRLDEFAAENPQYQRAIDLPRLLEAKAELGLHPGAHGHGGLINRLPPGLGLGASATLAMTGHGASAALPVAAEFAARNWPAISGRLLYTPAMEAQMLLGQGPRQLPSFLPQIEQEYQDALLRLQRKRGQEESRQ